MFSGQEGVQGPYQRDDIVEDYIHSRYGRDLLGRALHERQARLLRKVVSRQQVRKLLEVAPGPARLTVYASATECAYCVEQSAVMLRLAKARLAEFGVRCTPLAAQVVSRALEVVTPREPLKWMALCTCE
jgi:hypothetical protein